jgi:hypothetical protein
MAIKWHLVKDYSDYEHSNHFKKLFMTKSSYSEGLQLCYKPAHGKPPLERITKFDDKDEDPEGTEHSSASFYELGEIKNYGPLDFRIL